LNDTGSAGLGISVKGRKAAMPSVDGDNNNNNPVYADCGIYIKTVIHGGAAHKVWIFIINIYCI
jgi:hypothetical protein